MSFPLTLSAAHRATLLMPRYRGKDIDWEERRLDASELEHLTCRLELFLLGSARNSSTSSYCIVASEDPLTVILSCIAAWRSKHIVVLPNNLRERSLDELKTTFFGAQESPLPHPQLDDVTFQNALLGLDEAKPRHTSIQTRLEEDELCLICFTSGSTGRPQPHEKRARQVLGEARLLAELFFGDWMGAVACSVPAYHLYGVLFACLAPWLAGLPLLGAHPRLGSESLTPPPLRRLIEGPGASYLASVPAHLHALLSTDPQILTLVKRVFSSAAPLPRSVGRGILALDSAPELVEAWGSTETGGVATRRNDPGGTWIPLPSLLVQSNDDGRLVLDSPFAGTMLGSPIVTADRIERVDRGFVHLGRDDGVLKVGGKRISLQDLESCALAHPQVVDVACIAEQASGIRNQRVAMAVASQSPDVTSQTMRLHLALHFDEVVLPRRIRIVDSLPRTKTGKIRREDLLALLHIGPMNSKSISRDHALLDLRKAGFCDPILIDGASIEESRQVEFELSTDKSQIWFQGHFPGAPILPGVVQLRSLALRSAQALFADLGDLKSMTKVKFKRPIVPGDRLRVSLTRNVEKNSVSFSIQWLENRSDERSPLAEMLPHLFSAPAPSEASSGTLVFQRKN